MTNLRNDFPLLRSGISYLDNASTTLKPQVVIDAVSNYYSTYSANVHRGIYGISEQATSAYEQVRDQVQQLLGAAAREEIIFTSGTTQALNLAARLLAQRLQPGDEIILSRLDHHANLIPWQIVAKEKGLVLKFLETTAADELTPADLAALITPKTKVLSLTHISNVSGYITPVAEFTRIAHQHGLLVVADAAQSVPHLPLNVQALDVDMLAFSGHKLCGPTGVGVLYGKKALLESFEPVFGGGSMISDVELDHATWAELPLKFEPGTPPIASVIGLGAAINYIQTLGGLVTVHQLTQAVYDYALDQFAAAPGVTVYGPTNRGVRNGIISFTIAGVHPHDAATVLDQAGVAVRAGHHCAQPLHKKWGAPATVRASVYFYNTRADIDRLIAGITQVQTTFKK